MREGAVLCKLLALFALLSFSVAEKAEAGSCYTWTAGVYNNTPEGIMVRAARALPDGSCQDHAWPYMWPGENWRDLERRGYWDIDNLYVPQAYPPVCWAFFGAGDCYTYGIRLKRSNISKVEVWNSSEVFQNFRVRRVWCHVGCEWRNNW
jgi:hypothetical protein